MKNGLISYTKAEEIIKKDPALRDRIVFNDGNVIIATDYGVIKFIEKDWILFEGSEIFFSSKGDE